MLRQNFVMKEIPWNVPTFVSWLINPIRKLYILLNTEARYSILIRLIHNYCIYIFSHKVPVL